MVYTRSPRLSLGAIAADAKAKRHVRKYSCVHTPRTPITRIASGSLTRRAYHIAAMPVDQNDPSDGTRQQRTLSASSFEHHLPMPAPLQRVYTKSMEVDSPKAAMNNGPPVLERTLSASSFNATLPAKENNVLKRVPTVSPPRPTALKAATTSRRGLERQGAIVPAQVLQQARPAPLTRARAWQNNAQMLHPALIVRPILQRRGTLVPSTLLQVPLAPLNLQQNETQPFSAGSASAPRPLKRAVAEVDSEARYNLNIIPSDEPAAKRLRFKPRTLESPTPVPKWSVPGAETPIVRVSKAVQNTWHFKAILNKHHHDLNQYAALARLADFDMEALNEPDVDGRWY